MITVAPLQLDRLFKLFIGLLLGLLVVWSGFGVLIVGDIVMPRDLPLRLLFLGLVLLISAGLAWVVYTHYYHAVLSYDEVGFKLQRGRNQITGRWQDFSDVSLVHSGGASSWCDCTGMRASLRRYRYPRSSWSRPSSGFWR